MKRAIPNILTIARIVLCFVVFGSLTLLTARGHGSDFGLAPRPLMTIAFWSFAVAAITDFFDGYLARRWQVVSTMGAILDPIADKMLVTGAILGLLSMMSVWGEIASGLILFREFAVSAMREVLAPKGLKLPVTFFAKTKTALQLTTLGGYMFSAIYLLSPNLDGVTPDAPAWAQPCNEVFQAVYLFAAGVTVWTGFEYARAAHRALNGQDPKPKSSARRWSRARRGDYGTPPTDGRPDQ